MMDKSRKIKEQNRLRKWSWQNGEEAKKKSCSSRKMF
jgi:hypothetical protein